jgi:hypothetical protein
VLGLLHAPPRTWLFLSFFFWNHIIYLSTHYDYGGGRRTAEEKIDKSQTSGRRNGSRPNPFLKSGNSTVHTPVVAGDWEVCVCVCVCMCVQRER